MNTMSYQVAAQDDGAGGFLPVTFEKSNLGFSPADTYSSVQVSCKNLDGGYFDIWFKPRGFSEFVIFIEGATEADAVLLENRFVFEAIRIEFGDLGAGAAPVACPAFIKRSF